MSPRTPSLNALRAFEAAARHLSLAKAAEELRVTPSALSHQIRALETQIGVLLFERRSRTIALTPAGKMLLPGLEAGFNRIRQAVDEATRQQLSKVLVISTPPGLTARWLVPRLYRFAKANPAIDLRISSSPAYIDFHRDGIDVAIRNMTRTAPRNRELHYEKLLDMTLVPVCSPSLAEQLGGLRSPRSLLTAPLVHDESISSRANLPEWSDWLRAAGVAGVDLTRGLRFNAADHSLDAAVEGAGILLTQAILAYDDLRTGRLVMPWPLVLSTQRAYYFTCPRAALAREPVQSLRAWLKEEVGCLDLPKPIGRPTRMRRSSKARS